MVDVIISKGDNPQTTLQKGLALFEENHESIKSGSVIMIVFDYFLPEGHPSTVNPETFISLISYLEKKDLKKIYLVPGSIEGLDQGYLIQYLKTQYIFNTALIEFVSIDQLLIDPSIPTETGLKKIFKKKEKSTRISQIGESDGHPLIEDIDDYILLSQVRTEPVWKIYSSITLLVTIWRETTYFTTASKELSNDYEAKICNHLESILNWKIPLLTINDAYNILEGDGPCIWKNSTLGAPHKIILSDNCFAADWVTNQVLGLAPNNNFMLSYTNTQSNFGFNPLELKTKGDFSQAEPYPLKQVSEIIPEHNQIGVKIYAGQLNLNEKSALYYFIKRMERIMYKDAINMGHWAILVGKEPPEPSDQDFIILFGDNAINTTKSYQFRQISVEKEYLEGDALERAILAKQAKIRVKMDNYQDEYNQLMSNVILQKPKSEERHKIILEQELKLKLKMIGFQKKIEYIRIKLTADNLIAKEKSKIPKISISPNFVGISDGSLFNLDPFYSLSFLIAKKKIPTLRLFVSNNRLYYKFWQNNADLWKNTLKQVKSDLKLFVEEQQSPLKAEINEKITAINTEKREKQRTNKKEYRTKKSNIKKDYKQRLSEIGKSEGGNNHE